MTDLSEVSKALDAVMHQDRREAKQQLHDMVNLFGKDNVQNWLDDTVEYSDD